MGLGNLKQTIHSGIQNPEKKFFMNTQNLERFYITIQKWVIASVRITFVVDMLFYMLIIESQNCSASFSRTTSHFSCFMIIMPLKKWMVAICNGNLEKQTSFLMGSHFLENISIYYHNFETLLHLFSASWRFLDTQ